MDSPLALAHVALNAPNAPARPIRRKLYDVTNIGPLVLPFVFKQFDVGSIGYITLQCQTWILSVDARGPEGITVRVVKPMNGVPLTTAAASHLLASANDIHLPVVMNDNDVEEIMFMDNLVNATSFTTI